jgi:hypothetical protein
MMGHIIAKLQELHHAERLAMFIIWQAIVSRLEMTLKLKAFKLQLNEHTIPHPLARKQTL